MRIRKLNAWTSQLAPAKLALQTNLGAREREKGPPPALQTNLGAREREKGLHNMVWQEHMNALVQHI